MRGAMHGGGLVFGLLVSGSLCMAQEPGSPAAVLAAVLGKARDSGALSRLLEERRFLSLRSEWSYGLVTTRGKVLADGSGVELEYRNEGRGSFLRATCELAFTGKLRRLSQEQGVDGKTGRIEAKVEGDELEVTYDQDHPGRTLEWTGEMLPWWVAAWFLPRLADQGLPAELAFKAFDAALGSSHAATLRTSDGEATLSWQVKGEPRPTAFTLRLQVDGPDRGAILSMRRGEGIHIPLPPEAASVLLEAAPPKED